MLNKDYTAKLLNLEDVIITNVENFSGEVHVSFELPRAKHHCPACGTLTDRVHDYRMQTIKDVPLGRTTLLHLRKRRSRFFQRQNRPFPGKRPAALQQGVERVKEPSVMSFRGVKRRGNLM